MTRALSLVFVLGAVVSPLALASAVRAEGVALALNLPDENPVHRDFASGVAAEAAARWQMMSPQLDPNASTECKAEQQCLLRSARLRGATHLLLVGVAALGARDFVVSIQVFDVKASKELLAYSDVHAGGDDARATGREVALKQLASVRGLPAKEDAPPPSRAPDVAAAPPPVVDEAIESPPTLLGYAGFGVMGGALVVAAATAGIGAWALFTRPSPVDPQVMQGVGIGGAVLAGALFTGGVGLVVADAYAHR